MKIAVSQHRTPSKYGNSLPSVKRPSIAPIKRLARRVLVRLALLADEPANPDVEAWFAARGDETLRLDYDLTPNSVVVDVGGHEGLWSQAILERYGCRIWIFEPMPAGYRALTRRFGSIADVSVLPFGLAHESRSVAFADLGDRSSSHRTGDRTVAVELREVDGVLHELGITNIDLVKINIEGGEYDLLERLIACGWAARCRDIQIQFHRCVSDADARRQKIRTALAATHTLTYDFPFVWENWRRVS